ncbi:hypothetical protein ES332_D09G129500v1 [Gossypium tomentosum]|uniref:Uncharacterized protein n=1 Tax=Gossypium tomentosum TaxID=34277 RepID=A0A5D2JIK3_GOSTO|nr:hypothetical protein ES332_D09G129500v1 [Gossypium tomentosum]
MDEQEFRRLLDLFPVVRSGDYHAESASSRQAASCSASNEAIKDWQDAWHDERKETENQGTDLHDKFWQKLKLTAEKKVCLKLTKYCGFDEARLVQQRQTNFARLFNTFTGNLCTRG